MKPEIKAINCTTCGAPLDILGGHRVKSLTCGYCGSVMDSHAAFQTIQRHQERRDRPITPLAIGMQALLKDVLFTIIGMIEYVSHQSGPGWSESYRWVSFQLYSPTHGYCWLTWNKGHYFFSYRTRELPDPAVPKRGGMALEAKMPIWFEGTKFEVFESYPAEIAYVEGEFTWIAKLGDKVRVVEAIKPPRMFSYERTGQALEYAIGHYMNAADVHDAFGLPAPDPPTGIHPAQPFDGGRLLPALAKAGPIFAGIAILCLFLALSAGRGSEFLRAETTTQRGSLTVPFDAPNVDQLLRLEVSAPLTNNWVYYDVTITDAKTGDEVLFLGKELSFYEGRDSDGYWSEGSRTESALFKLPAPGNYELEIMPTESGGRVPPFEIRLYDNVMVKRYFFVLLVLSVIAAVSLPIYRRRFEKQRWDDVLDDDDD